MLLPASPNLLNGVIALRFAYLSWGVHFVDHLECPDEPLLPRAAN